MKFLLLFITLNVFFTLNIFSQTKKSNEFLAHESPRNYDVIKYDLQVDWVDILPSTKYEPEKRQWNGMLTITLVPLENNFSLVELDAVKLKINEIWIKNNKLTKIPNNSNGLLSIPVPTSQPRDTIYLLLNYTYNNPYNIGFFHRNSLDNYIENGVDIPVAGTLSEPQDARYWFPCNDRPNDKALVNIAATVPAGMLAASNGRLDSTKIAYKNNTPYSETFYWTSSHPIPPYLITIAASEYKLNIEKIPIASASTDSIDVYYYTWNNDWKGNATHNLSRFAATTPKTMQIFGDLFGSYPFEKYGVAVLDYTLLGANSLGMEHQTLTTISRDWFENHMPIPEFTSFAHELAHSWFGNMVTCHTWKDIWFNEGGATWLEAIYLENIQNYVDSAAYYNQMKNNRYSYLSNKKNTYEMPLYLDDNTEPFWHISLIYSKASWVFHHLRMLLGDDVFSLLKQMLEQYKFGTITSQEFVDFFVNNVPNPPNNIDMKRFLEQFIFQAGHPIYNINTSVTKINDNYNVSVLLEQTQNANNVPKEFLMNLNILFFDEYNNIIHSEFIINDSRQQAYSFNFPAAPEKLILDTTKALLEVNKNTLLDDIWDATNSKDILIYPNPTTTGQLTIQFNSDIPMNWNQQVEIIDMLSNSYYLEITQVDDNTFSIDISKLAIGVYFLKINGLNTPNNQYTTQFTILK